MAAMRPTPSPKPSLVFDSPSAPSSAPLGARDISSNHSDGSIGGNTPGEDMVILSEEEQREEALAAQIAAQAGDLLEEEENADSGDDDQTDHQLTYDWENSDDAAEEDGDATALSVAEGPLALRTDARARTEASAVAERRTEPPSVHFRRQVVPGSVMSSSSSAAVFLSILRQSCGCLPAARRPTARPPTPVAAGWAGPWNGRETVTRPWRTLVLWTSSVRRAAHSEDSRQPVWMKDSLEWTFSLATGKPTAKPRRRTRKAK